MQKGWEYLGNNKMADDEAAGADLPLVPETVLRRRRTLAETRAKNAAQVRC